MLGNSKVLYFQKRNPVGLTSDETKTTEGLKEQNFFCNCLFVIKKLSAVGVI